MNDECMVFVIENLECDNYNVLSIRNIIEDWRNEIGMKSPIVIGMDTEHGILNIHTDNPALMIGKFTIIYEKYHIKLSKYIENLGLKSIIFRRTNYNRRKRL